MLLAVAGIHMGAIRREVLAMRRFLGLLGAWILLAAPMAASAVSFSEVYVFGDSLSDTGNLFLATGQTIPDPAYYDNGRFQNGPSYVEGLADNFGVSADPALFGGTGTNYAVGGARSRYHNQDLDSNGAPPLGVDPPALFSLLWQMEQFYVGLGGGGIGSPRSLRRVGWGERYSRRADTSIAEQIRGRQ